MKLITTVSCDFDLELLPHFCRHYRNLGVRAEDFLIILHSESGDFSKARHICFDEYIQPVSSWSGEFTSNQMNVKRKKILDQVCNDGEWIVHADVDEFHKPKHNIYEVIDICREIGCNAVQSVYIDRISVDGSLNTICPNTSIWEQFPISCDICNTIQKYATSQTTKMFLYKFPLYATRGGHYIDVNIDQNKVKYLAGKNLSYDDGIKNGKFKETYSFPCYHFKWHAGVIAKLQKRCEVYKKNNMNWYTLSERLLESLTPDGKIDLTKIRYLDVKQN